MIMHYSVLYINWRVRACDLFAVCPVLCCCLIQCTVIDSANCVANSATIPYAKDKVVVAGSKTPVLCLYHPLHLLNQ